MDLNLVKIVIDRTLATIMSSVQPLSILVISLSYKFNKVNSGFKLQKK